jgi:hypothetical protein
MLMTLGEFLRDVLIIFMLVLWFWLLITVMSDLFRRHDIGGFSKVIWVILLIVLPYFGIFIYLLTQGSGMGERSVAQAAKVRDDLRNVIGFSAADELKKIDDLKADGKISDAEYKSMRARIIA